MDIKKIIWNYGLIVIFICVAIVDVIFFGGALILAKTGEGIKGFWVEHFPAGAGGLVCVIGGSAVAYGAVVVKRIPLVTRILLLSGYVVIFAATTVTFPVYMYASTAGENGETVTFKKAIEQIHNEGKAGKDTLKLYFLMICAIQIVSPLVLIASHYQATEKRRTEDQESKRIEHHKELELGEDKSRILKEINDSAMGMTRKEIELATGIVYHRVVKLTQELVSDGAIETDGAAKNARFWSKQ